MYFRRCVACRNSFFCRISEKAHRNVFQHEIPILSRLSAFACMILISRWSFFPACKSVGSFATSRASAHRAAKKAKSSKKRWRGRLLVAYRSTTIDLKCLARIFVGKLITFRRLRFNCTSCEWAREMHRRKSNTSDRVGHRLATSISFVEVRHLFVSNFLADTSKLSLTLTNLTECKQIAFHHMKLVKTNYVSNNSPMLTLITTKII